MSEHDIQADLDSRRRYRIVRHYFHGSRKRTILSGLTLAQAQAHCQSDWAWFDDDENNGAWFDGYEVER